MMKIKVLQVFILVACLLTTLSMVPTSADDLLRTDFQEESFAKTVDYFEYARAWALLNGARQCLHDLR